MWALWTCEHNVHGVYNHSKKYQTAPCYPNASSTKFFKLCSVNPNSIHASATTSWSSFVSISGIYFHIVTFKSICFLHPVFEEAFFGKRNCSCVLFPCWMAPRLYGLIVPGFGHPYVDECTGLSLLLKKDVPTPGIKTHLMSWFYFAPRFWFINCNGVIPVFFLKAL